MSTNTLSTESQSNAPARIIRHSLGYDFALLGLNVRESRVEVIRSAAERTAERIHQAAIDAHDQDSMLSELAASTYRLLDPRRRQKMMERVQLSVPSEVDLDLQKESRIPLLHFGRLKSDEAIAPDQASATARMEYGVV